MHEKSIELLNRAIADELSAVHQYMYFHFRLDDLGYDPLAAMFKRIAIDEMVHTEKLSERILFLGGDIEMKMADPVQQIHEVRGMLERAKGMEHQSQLDYNKWALECSQNADAGSKRIFEGLVESEERHYDIFDRQVDAIEKFGERYLALQSFQEDPIGPGGGDN